ncbi:AAA family ATPase [Lachnospiraceae bacterium 48-42]
MIKCYYSVLQEGDTRFIFVLDEWDFIFHRDFVREKEKKEYIDFLSNLLKDQPYVDLAYMTGILPIAKYSSGSELNMFLEYTMASEEMFSDVFGFTEAEVDLLFGRFLTNQENPKITRKDLKIWYDGYSSKAGNRIYNPRSVVAALTNNNLGNYWTSSGPYDEIFYYIRHNTDAVRDDLARMVSGIPVHARIREYAATSMKLSCKRRDIFSNDCLWFPKL